MLHQLHTVKTFIRCEPLIVPRSALQGMFGSLNNSTPSVRYDVAMMGLARKEQTNNQILDATEQKCSFSINCSTLGGILHRTVCCLPSVPRSTQPFSCQANIRSDLNSTSKYIPPLQGRHRLPPVLGSQTLPGIVYHIGILTHVVDLLHYFRVALGPTRHSMEAKQALPGQTVSGHPSHRTVISLSPLPVWLNRPSRPISTASPFHRAAGLRSASTKTFGQHTPAACRNSAALSPPPTHGPANTRRRCIRTWAAAAAVHAPGTSPSANDSQSTPQANIQHLNAQYPAVTPLPPPPKSAELMQVRGAASARLPSHLCPARASPGTWSPAAQPACCRTASVMASPSAAATIAR